MSTDATRIEPPGSRREFCACALALGATVACGGGGGGSSTNNPGGGGGNTPITTTDTKAGLLAQPAGTVRSYANGASACPDTLGAAQVVYLVRVATGIYAISASCLHMGGRIQPAGSGFSCACHGSQYDLGGTVTVGPAPVGSVLAHYEVRESSPGAVLVIDTSKAVGAGVRLS